MIFNFVCYYPRHQAGGVQMYTKIMEKVCVKAKKIAPKCDFRRERRGLFFVCSRIRFGINGRSIIYSTEFLCCLAKATHNRIERLFHRSFDIQYHMQMVWHQAKLKDTHMRINSPHFEYLLYDFLYQLFGYTPVSDYSPE